MKNERLSDEFLELRTPSELTKPSSAHEKRKNRYNGDPYFKNPFYCIQGSCIHHGERANCNLLRTTDFGGKGCPFFKKHKDDISGRTRVPTRECYIPFEEDKLEGLDEQKDKLGFTSPK